MENKTKDEGKPRGGVEETECVCCEDGECSWNPNGKSDKKEWTDD